MTAPAGTAAPAPPPPESERPPAALPTELAEPGGDSGPHGFVGRDGAILALERALRKRPAAVLIHGWPLLIAEEVRRLLDGEAVSPLSQSETAQGRGADTAAPVRGSWRASAP